MFPLRFLFSNILFCSVFLGKFIGFSLLPKLVFFQIILKMIGFHSNTGIYNFFSWISCSHSLYNLMSPYWKWHCRHRAIRFSSVSAILVPPIPLASMWWMSTACEPQTSQGMKSVVSYPIPCKYTFVCFFIGASHLCLQWIFPTIATRKISIYCKVNYRSNRICVATSVRFQYI